MSQAFSPVRFTCEGLPCTQGSTVYYAGRVHHVKRRELKDWRERIAWAARKAIKTPFTATPLEVFYVFKLPRPASVRRCLPWVKPDLDKLVRAVNDGLVDSGMVDEDSRIVVMCASKFYAEAGESVGVTVTVRAVGADECGVVA